MASTGTARIAPRGTLSYPSIGVAVKSSHQQREQTRLTSNLFVSASGSRLDVGSIAIRRHPRKGSCCLSPRHAPFLCISFLQTIQAFDRQFQLQVAYNLPRC